MLKSSHERRQMYRRIIKDYGYNTPEVLVGAGDLRSFLDDIDHLWEIVSFAKKSLDDAGFENLPQVLKEIKVLTAERNRLNSKLAEAELRHDFDAVEIERLREREEHYIGVADSLTEAEARLDAVRDVLTWGHTVAYDLREDILAQIASAEPTSEGDDND